MKNIIIAIVLVAILISGFYFINTKNGNIEANHYDGIKINFTEKSKCESNGGKWEKVGRAQVYACVNYYSDAGKECKYSNECEGNCMVRNQDDKPTCEQKSTRFGCKATIEEINAGQGILCID